jgi:hypothetical protein
MTINWDAVSAIAASISALAVVFAMLQLRATKRIGQLQFEDQLAKEYRELAARIPTKAMLGGRLSRQEYQEAFDELFHYIDLSNEQCMLRKHGRVRKEVWDNWREGIESNLKLPAFAQAWNEIKKRTESFKELRNLEENFNRDPFERGIVAWSRRWCW